MNPPPQPLPRPATRPAFGVSRARGSTLVEVTIAVGVFVVAALGSMTLIVSSLKLDGVNRESALARNAARQAIERMKGTTFRQVYATYDADPANDPGGAGTASGSKFTVRGLSPQPGLATVGDIVFPVNGGTLKENVAMPDLGMPLDLNADGKIDGSSRAADYFVLPVLVRVRWRGVTGDRQYVLRTVLCP